MHLVLADVDRRPLRELASSLPGALAGAYIASKHAVVALSEALVQGLALRGARVGVSVLCPGWVATALASSGPGAADRMMRSLISRGLPPEAVADRTVHAVRAGEF